MFYVKLDRKWLGRNYDRVDFDSPAMAEYKTLRNAIKAAKKAAFLSLSYSGDPIVCTIDWSKPHCPVSEVK